jgi:hypothetical protein
MMRFPTSTRWVLSLALMLAIHIGCAKKEEPKPEEPPPPSTDQIMAEMRQSVQPLFDGHNLNAGLQEDLRLQTVNNLRTAINKFAVANNPNLPEAKRRIKNDIEDLLKKAREADRWRVVKGCCEAIRVIEPSDERFKKVEERADLILARPVVQVKGFFETDGHLVAFLRVRDPKTDKVTTYKIREGEDFHDVFRLVKIVGNQESVEILYKPIDDTYVVKAPSALNSANTRLAN